nr:hypothetical protein [Neorhizobium tomejilense]
MDIHFANAVLSRILQHEARRQRLGVVQRKFRPGWLRLRSTVEEGYFGDIDTEALIDFAAGLASWQEFVPDHFEDQIDILSKLVEEAGTAKDPVSRPPRS